MFCTCSFFCYTLSKLSCHTPPTVYTSSSLSSLVSLLFAFHFCSSDSLIIFLSTDSQLLLALFHSRCLLLLPSRNFFSVIYMCTCLSKGGTSKYARERRSKYLCHELNAAYIHCLDNRTDQISFCAVILIRIG